MHDVDVGVLLDPKDEPAISAHVNRSRSVNSQFRHPKILAALHSLAEILDRLTDLADSTSRRIFHLAHNLVGFAFGSEPFVLREIAGRLFGPAFCLIHFSAYLALIPHDVLAPPVSCTARHVPVAAQFDAAVEFLAHGMQVSD
jgi:hypothetical protein